MQTISASVKVADRPAQQTLVAGRTVTLINRTFKLSKDSPIVFVIARMFLYFAPANENAPAPDAYILEAAARSIWIDIQASLRRYKTVAAIKALSLEGHKFNVGLLAEDELLAPVQKSTKAKVVPWETRVAMFNTGEWTVVQLHDSATPAEWTEACNFAAKMGGDLAGLYERTVANAAG